MFGTDFSKSLRKFRHQLTGVRQQHSSVSWYPYDTLATLELLFRSLKDLHDILPRSKNRPMLDVGCADGAAAFFFESLGFTVDAIDHFMTNYNEMQGIRTLKAALKSGVAISDVNLDAGHSLPRDQYGLTLALGVLYHLKNPYTFLETLSRRAEHCLLSTRVAAYTPDGQSIQRLPVGYLVDYDETNNDPTNFWVFSEAGLATLFRRTGWKVKRLFYEGASESHAASDEADQRAFCLLQSVYAENLSTIELGHGWHELEYLSWRWTAKSFSVFLNRRSGERGAGELTFAFTVPPALVEGREVTLKVDVDGTVLPPKTLDVPGETMYRAVLPTPFRKAERLHVNCSLDYAIRPPDDPRELGVIVKFFEDVRSEPVKPFALL